MRSKWIPQCHPRRFGGRPFELFGRSQYRRAIASPLGHTQTHRSADHEPQNYAPLQWFHPVIASLSTCTSSVFAIFRTFSAPLLTSKLLGNGTTTAEPFRPDPQTLSVSWRDCPWGVKQDLQFLLAILHDVGSAVTQSGISPCHETGRLNR